MTARLTSAGFNLTGWRMRDPRLHEALRGWRRQCNLSDGKRVVMPFGRSNSLLIEIGQTVDDVRYRAVSEDIARAGFDFTGRRLAEIELGGEDFFRGMIHDAAKRASPVYGWVDFSSFAGEKGQYEVLALPIGHLLRPKAMLVIESMTGFIREETPEFLVGKLKAQPPE